MDIINNLMDLLKNGAIFGGTLWALWGVIVLASGLKDKNGPQLQSGIWQIVGGVIIVSAAAYFASITF